jgi:hypothetical protein
MEIDLGRVLDSQYMSAGNRRSGLITPSFDQSLNCHSTVCQKPSESDFLRTSTMRQPPHADRGTRNHALEQRPFCRDDDLRNGPTISLAAPWRHLGLSKVSTTESHGRR